MVNSTKRSQKPPHPDDASIINFQKIRNDVSSSLYSISLFLRHVALSDIIRLGILLREINHFSDLINDDGLGSGARSKWTAGLLHNYIILSEFVEE